MARVDSYNGKSMVNLIKEHYRDLDDYKNNVDRTKSNSNIVIGNYNSTNEMISGIKKRAIDIMAGKDIQKQTNLISEWVISYPKNCPVPPDQFFKSVYAFYSNRYKAENVMGGFVHMDETNPHMHLDFVPEAVSRKTGRKTVSSASLLTREELSNCQADLEKYCTNTFHVKGLILNGKTKQDGLTLDGLKRLTGASEGFISYLKDNKGIDLESELTRYKSKQSLRHEPQKPVQAPQKPIQAPKREIPTIIPESVKKQQEEYSDDVTEQLPANRLKTPQNARMSDPKTSNDDFFNEMHNNAKRAGDEAVKQMSSDKFDVAAFQRERNAIVNSTNDVIKQANEYTI